MGDLRVFTANELESATQKFSGKNSLGRGGFGTGYKGQLSDGTPVLVMKLNPDNSRQAAEKFKRETALLTRADHPSIVKLLGYNSNSRCLVYELLPAGNLEERLLTEEKRKTLRQMHRLKIAAQAAEALVFLHRLDPPILHQDVKPGNLMLDDDLSCKVGGVGLAKFLPQNDSSIWGTVGYIDPLLLRSGKYGPQSDVYGLGLVILQLLTGEKVNKVLELAKFGLDGILEHLDKSIEWNNDVVKEVAEMALRCRDKANRPDLESVVLPMLQIFAKQTAEAEAKDGRGPVAPQALHGAASSDGGKGGKGSGAAALPKSGTSSGHKKTFFGYFFGASKKS